MAILSVEIERVDRLLTTCVADLFFMLNACLLCRDHVLDCLQVLLARATPLDQRVEPALHILQLLN